VVPSPAKLREAAVSAARRLADGKPETALQLLNEVVASDDWNAEAHNLLGILHDNAKRSVEAIRHFQRAVDIEPNRSVYWYDLGVACGAHNDYRTARAPLQGRLSANWMPSPNKGVLT
jgi:Flp pilus assembly protein TadD